MAKTGLHIVRNGMVRYDNMNSESLPKGGKAGTMVPDRVLRTKIPKALGGESGGLGIRVKIHSVDGPLLMTDEREPG